MDVSMREMLWLHTRVVTSAVWRLAEVGGAARLRPPASSSSTLAPAQHSSQHPQPAMDRDSLTLQINNMRFQAKMERWPLSKSIEA